MNDADKKLAIKIAGLLTSEHDGERANAGAKLTDIARRNKLSMAELLTEVFGGGGKTFSYASPSPREPEPDFTDINQSDDLLQMLQRIADRPDMAERVLTNWEINFATDVAGRYDADCELSDKQLVIVEKILRKASRVFPRPA